MQAQSFVTIDSLSFGFYAKELSSAFVFLYKVMAIVPTFQQAMFLNSRYFSQPKKLLAFSFLNCDDIFKVDKGCSQQDYIFLQLIWMYT